MDASNESRERNSANDTEERDVDDFVEDEPNQESNDVDSALGDEENLSTASLTSTIWNYQYTNGRRYNSFRAGQYWMPNDEQEQGHLDLFHHICTLLLGGELYCAPVKDPQEILEIGTGTGIWAIDVADKFPAARVIATDLSPIQPTWVPPNLDFEIDDCESEWSFKQNFDFIHMRNMGGSITDWRGLLKSALDHMKPGAWIEVSNVSPTRSDKEHEFPKDSPSLELRNQLLAAARATGREIDVGPYMGSYMSEIGFVNVRTDSKRIPTSRWMSGRQNHELVSYFQPLLLEQIEGMSLALFTTVLGWSMEELQILLAGARRDFKDPRLEIYSTMQWTYGKKPETSIS